MKVFLSHRMSGVPRRYVEALRAEVSEYLSKILYAEHDIEIIDNYNHENVPEDAGRLWHLGCSIQQMEQADLVVFIRDGMEPAKGCIIEEIICNQYNIDFMVYKPLSINIDNYIRTDLLPYQKQLSQFECIPTEIFNCKGCIVEYVSTPEFKLLINDMRFVLKMHGYNFYFLGHDENDWSEPSMITSKNLLVNRFGIFFTKTNMEDLPNSIFDVYGEADIPDGDIMYYDYEDGILVEECGNIGSVQNTPNLWDFINEIENIM